MRTVLVTGASSGIGAATARRLDDLGIEVFAGVRDDDVTFAGGSERLRGVTLDVTDPASIEAAIATISDHVGGRGLDAVINNAGIGVAGPLEVLELDAIREQLEVNVIGQIAVTQAALPLLRQAGGRVVFVGSIGGRLASAFAGPYHASKFAIEAVADVWRQELEPEELSVVLVEPSAISTPIWDKAIARIDALLAGDDPRMQRYRERLRAFRESLQSADEHGKSADDVAEVIEKALTAGHPRPRYVVGAGGRIATTVRPLIPDRIADRLGELIHRA
jgi:NAD(P)-dependent dehydrogenase (short-subunit alcohol dehydrogenase family)